MLKLVSFRLDDATLQNLDTIKTLLPKYRQAPCWATDESRTSALRYAVQKIAAELVKDSQQKEEAKPKPKPKKKGKVKT